MQALEIDNPPSPLDGRLPLPGAVLGALASRDLEALAEPAVEELPRYGFTAAGIGLLVSSGLNAELVPASAVFRMPNSPAWLAGLMNVRGNLLPVVNLARLLGWGAAAASPAAVLMFGKGERAIGVFIDKLPQPVRAMQAVQEQPPEILRSYVTAAYGCDGRTWFEISHDAFFESLVTLDLAHRAIP